MSDTNLADASAIELTAGYRAGAFSPVEVIDAVLARVESAEGTLHATYALDPESARKAAEESARRWRSGEALGALDGVPATVKENIATEGVPVPLGTAATELRPAAQDAPAAARLREAGAVIFTKTTMPDYGMLSSGASSFHPLARNPWDPTRGPGGSSAGAGAAAAAGYGPLHLGTDIGGSVRLPATWCGVVGLKPSHGLVPVDPPYYGRVVGPLTRTVADTALLMSVIAAPDARDHTALPALDLHWDRPAVDVRGLRLGLLLDAGIGLPVQPEVRDAVAGAARALEAAGAVVEPIEPYLTRDMLDGLDRFWRARAWSDIRDLSPERTTAILPQIVEWARGGRELTGAEVFHGFSQMDEMAKAADRLTRTHDFVLSPVAPITAFPAELAYPTDDPGRPFEHIAFTVAYNMSGQPALSINCGWTENGLPIGLQIIGRRFDDLGVLGLARAYEQLRGAGRPWPTVPGQTS